MLSRTVEDAGTVTSPLVPWNSCGAYMAGVLGVATIAYLPYCFFNLVSPVIALIYGFTGFHIEHLPATETGEPPASQSPGSRRPPESTRCIRRTVGDDDAAMTATATPAMDTSPPENRRGLKLPSAYTILFILIVVVAALTWIIPAGRYDFNADGTPIPGTYHTVPANPPRIIIDSLHGADQRPVRHQGRRRQHQRLQQRRAVRRHRRRAVHPGHRRLPRA